MKITRCALVLLLALCAAPAWADELDFGMGLTGYPQMVLVPDYPVYYAPNVAANYFFYEGDFWLYQDDNWYTSPWYDGPWDRVDPEEVPDVLLQVPIRYYVAPPAFFFSWYIEEPPHWGEHWGHDWEEHRRGWHHRHDMYGKPAPLPDYQRHYSGGRYPRERERQHELQHGHYHYQAHDPLVLQHQQTQPVQIAPALPGMNRPSEAARPVHRHVPRQEAQHHEHAQEQGSATTQPGTVRREQPIRDHGESRRPENEGGEGQRGHEDRGRER